MVGLQDRAIFSARPIESRKRSLERRHFQWPWSWTTPNQVFKVTPFVYAEYVTYKRLKIYTANVATKCE